jgi:hypothetical protein
MIKDIKVGDEIFLATSDVNLRNIEEFTAKEVLFIEK